jgi:hypothetical protein
MNDNLSNIPKTQKTNLTNNQVKSCTLLYGYDEHCLDLIQDSPILLIEPRKNYIDKIKSLHNPNIILISKLLVKSNGFKETTLYCDNDLYWTQEESLSVNGTNMFNVKKYIVFTITLESIITQYKIQNIDNFIVNINIRDINEILDSLLPYNHILSKITLYTKNVQANTCKILSYYKLERSDKTDTDTHINTEQQNDKLVHHHKNLTIDLPNIGLYFINDLDKANLNDMTLLMQQYKMNIIIDKGEKDKYIVPYPESVQIIQTNDIIKAKPSKIYSENVVNALDSIFSKESPINCSESTIKSNELDIIIQFNTKYFSSYKTLQIMHPLPDNTIYINRMYDIMYATKNCMYMIYQILKSRYFTEYIDQKRNEKPTLFKIFSKRYFYEYLSKIFVFKEF